MRLVVSKYQYYICILDLFSEIKKILKNLAFNALLFLALKFSGICFVLSVLFWRRVNSPLAPPQSSSSFNCAHAISSQMSVWMSCLPPRARHKSDSVHQTLSFFSSLQHFSRRHGELIQSQYGGHEEPFIN